MYFKPESLWSQRVLDPRRNDPDRILPSLGKKTGSDLEEKPDTYSDTRKQPGSDFIKFNKNFDAIEILLLKYDFGHKKLKEEFDSSLILERF